MKNDGLVNSILEFEDKYKLPPITPEQERWDGENIECRIPELDVGERIVLNAHGFYEVHHDENYRRRLGIFSVQNKTMERRGLAYTLRQEERFNEGHIIHQALSGTLDRISLKNFKYIALDETGKPLN